MAKARSPQYPVIGLGEAVAKAKAVYGEDYQNRIPKLVVAKHMGFKALHGKSLGVLATLSRYGLLEGRGAEYRVTDRAVAILAHPPGSPERIAEIKAAAGAPAIFQDLDKRFPDGKGSDEGLRAYLLTNHFIPDAAETVIRSYRETKRVVAAEAKGYDSTSEEEAFEALTGVAIVDADTARQHIPLRNRPPPPPSDHGKVRIMEGERVVFTEESDPQRYVKLIANGDVDETMLDALSDYVKRQRKRLGLSEESKPS